MEDRSQFAATAGFTHLRRPLSHLIRGQPTLALCLEQGGDRLLTLGITDAIVGTVRVGVSAHPHSLPYRAAAWAIRAPSAGSAGSRTGRR